MGVADNIKHLRVDNGWTQEQLAKKINVSRATVTQWETGWSQPRMGAIQRLAGVFGVSISKIVDDISYAVVSFDEDKIELRDDERNLIRSYRMLDSTNKMAVIQLVSTLSHDRTDRFV